MFPEDVPDRDDGPGGEDDIWADSADRKVTLRALDEHRAEEHLSAEEHGRRCDLARHARTRGDLRALFADLPAPHPLIEDGTPWTGGGGTSWIAGAAQAGGGAGLLLITGAVVVVAAALAGWWVPAVIFACLLVVATVFVTFGRN